jgi:tRNA-splicing ligase RtcB (3'-phosphate/5'-hydroxy nucleic acid ligase)
MAKLRLTAKHLRDIGYENARIIQTAMMFAGKHYKDQTQEWVLALLKNVLNHPEEFLEDKAFGKIAEQLLEKTVVTQDGLNYNLNKEGIEYNTFGAENIEQGAIQQIKTAARLPIALAAALMPDAHQGYGLPIGGVLATDNAVIPYGVGVDIGCRMCLSIFALPTTELATRQKEFSKLLLEHTKFGMGMEFSIRTEHAVLDNPAFNQNSFLKNLQQKAARQLGTSGSGNHFVEFGSIEITEYDPVLGVAPGKYVGLLSHSGSRGLGANIAQHYTKIAMDSCRLPQEAKHLAWLDLNSDQGASYWLAMNLAGDYASACHDTIHRKIAKALGENPLRRVENHHNFAWKEIIDGREMIVHRKGATPAQQDELGIIPGSMTAPGFIVKGKGEVASLNSASHGAGRCLSRTQAQNSTTQHALKALLKKHDVLLLGGGLDEAPHAYKDIEMVMNAQKKLVDTLGVFYPKIVRMDG